MQVHVIKANGQESSSADPSYLKMSLKCHNLKSMVVTGHEKKFTLI